MISTLAPTSAPKKLLFCRKNVLRGKGPTPLGAQMGSSPSCDATSTATTGAWPSPLAQLPARGPRRRSWFPPRSPKMAGLQGKSRRVRGPCPLGAGMDSSGGFSSSREVLPQGGHDLRRQLSREGAARQLGVHDRHLWPSSAPQEVAALQEKCSMPRADAFGCAHGLVCL